MKNKYLTLTRRLMPRMLICATLILGGCQTTSLGTNSACILWEPIQPSRVDVLTDGTTRQIIENNAKRRGFCGS